MSQFAIGFQFLQWFYKNINNLYFCALSEACRTKNEELKDEAGGWTEVIGVGKIEHTVDEDKEEIVPNETIHEVAVGKGLLGVLKLLKE